MREKLVSVFLILICLFAFYLLTVPVNAQNTTLKLYQIDEGIDLAKSTGKPIAILIPEGKFDEDTISEINNNFININKTTSGQLLDKNLLILAAILQVGEPPILVILDSNGKEITRVTWNGVRLDADGKEIGKIQTVIKDMRIQIDKNTSDFLYETYKYAVNKNGKIQRLPQEIGLVSVKDLLADRTGKYYNNYITISGFIHDIKYMEAFYYEFSIDDGTGVTNLVYSGGLGDIKENDKVFVKMLYYERSFNARQLAITVSKDQIPTKVNPSGSDGSPSATPKAPGFEIVIGVVAIFLISRKIIKRR